MPPRTMAQGKGSATSNVSDKGSIRPLSPIYRCKSCGG